MKKFRVWFIAIMLAVASGLVAPGPASAAPYCGLVWGSLVKADPAMSQAQVTNVRTGQHYCFDRLVIDLNGPVGRLHRPLRSAGDAGRLRLAGPAAGPGVHPGHSQRPGV